LIRNNSQNYISFGEGKDISLESFIEIVNLSLTKEELNELIEKSGTNPEKFSGRVLRKFGLRQDKELPENKVYNLFSYLYKISAFKSAIRAVISKKNFEDLCSHLIPRLDEANQDYKVEIGSFGDDLTEEKILKLAYSKGEFDIRYLWLLVMSDSREQNELLPALEDGPYRERLIKIIESESIIDRKYPETVAQLQSLQKILGKERKQRGVMEAMVEEQSQAIETLTSKLERTMKLLRGYTKSIDSLQREKTDLEKRLSEMTNYPSPKAAEQEYREESSDLCFLGDNPLYNGNIVVFGYKGDKEELEEYFKTRFGVARIEVFIGSKKHLRKFQSVQFDKVDMVIGAGSTSHKFRDIIGPRNKKKIVMLEFTNLGRMDKGILEHLEESYNYRP